MADLYLYASGGSPGTKLSTGNFKFSKFPHKLVKEHRLANGGLRRDVIATKHTFNLSWEWLPSLDADVCDGGLGADSLETLFVTIGALMLSVPNDLGGADVYETLPPGDSFKRDRNLRRANGKTFWNVSIALEEV